MPPHFAFLAKGASSVSLHTAKLHAFRNLRGMGRQVQRRRRLLRHRRFTVKINLIRFAKTKVTRVIWSPCSARMLGSGSGGFCTVESCKRAFLVHRRNRRKVEKTT